MGHRLISLLLVLTMMLSILPLNVFAAQENRFILVAEADANNEHEAMLIIEPEYISYTEGQTVKEALMESDHEFTGMEDGWITAIDGIVGNFKRSDENGGFDLEAPASEMQFYRFSEEENSRPSVGLQQLMTAMADYKEKDADVRAAAEDEYTTACEQFVGIDSDSAAYLAENLNAAVEAYESSQNSGTFTVTFTVQGGEGDEAYIVAENSYGKTWTAENCEMELPAGEYSFVLTEGDLRAEGELEVAVAMEVEVNLPTEHWLDLEAFRLSGSYGSENSAEGKFTDDEYELPQWDERRLTVAVSDTFTGTVYSYVEQSDALDGIPTLTAIYTSPMSGDTVKQEIPFESWTSGAVNVLKKGAQGNTVIYRVSQRGEDGFLYSQDYTVEFARIPSLKSISVKDAEGIDQAATEAFDSSKTEYTYKVVDTVSSVLVSALPADENYLLSINGTDVDADMPAEIAVDGKTEISIQVSANGYTNTYYLTVLPGEGKAISFITENQSVTLEVVNSNGEVLPYDKFKEGEKNRYRYVLVPGETYSYVATDKEYYHAADQFTMEETTNSTINVSVPTDDWLTSMEFGVGEGSGYKGELLKDTPFSPADHHYQVELVDTEHTVYAWVEGQKDTRVKAIYQQTSNLALYHGKKTGTELSFGKTTGEYLKRLLMDENPLGNTLTLRLSKEVDGITQYQDYCVDFSRTLTLEDLTAKCDGVTTSLVQQDKTVGFDSDVMEYSVTASMAAKQLELSPLVHDGSRCYGEEEVGYRVRVNGEICDGDTVAVELNGGLETETVEITVENDKAPKGTVTYILHVLKSPPIETYFELTPADALLAVYETMSGERVWPDENGSFLFCEDYSYDYVLTDYAYVGKAGRLEATRNENNALVIRNGDADYPVEENNDGGSVTIRWSLEQAAVNSSLDANIEAEWNNFRGNENNNAVVDTPIPAKAEEGTLYWANQIGSGIDSDAVGSPIIVDGNLITYASDEIYKVDTVTGEIKATGKMDHKSSFSITPPTYAEGMVFVALSNGTVQAFNADTLESLWVYTDPLGGQPNCPLTVKNGYIYTGFWNSETGDANFVCLSVTDEDPAKTKETKHASWYYTAKGGFYWAGAYVSDDYVLVGTDDGTTSCIGQSSNLLLLDAKNGKLYDAWEDLDGDVRSTVVYDTAADTYYFTSKGGSFYGVRTVKTAEGWGFANGWSVKLNNNTDATPMSTSSPVVYNGRAYVGVSGSGQFSAYSGHNITVIDLSKKKIAYSVQTQGYPQTSGLLTTAYEDESGYVYIYFFDNMTPGKLRVLRDKADQTKADYVTVEDSFNTAYALFAPTGDHAQYAICSPITDEYGTIYFKNDSGYLMAFGSMVEKIEVTKNPLKMTYAAGETFDPAGMVVTATYSNGKTRDISKYVTYGNAAFSEENNRVTISFPYVLYHNAENGTAMTSGINTSTPTVTLEVQINGSAADTVLLGDVNADGAINTIDAAAIISCYYGKVEFSDVQRKAADVNHDQTVNTIDAAMIISHYYGKISSFPAAQ